MQAYVKTGLAYKQKADEALDNWCDILLPKTRPIVIGCYYRPSKQINFVELFEVFF